MAQYNPVISPKDQVQKFALLRSCGSAVITAVSRDKHFFALQGAIFIHDMGGVVFMVSESGEKIPVGIIIEVIPGFETQALAVSIHSIIDLFDTSIGQDWED